MTKPRKQKALSGQPAPVGKYELRIGQRAGESVELTLARTLFDPVFRHASLASSFAQPVFGNDHVSSLNDSAAVLGEGLDNAAAGDLSVASRILAAQAVSLDAIFTDLGRRAGANIGQHIAAMERYMRLALKAQAACRTTLEALARLHQPREQTVRHVHVNEGGQAVIAEQFHHHAGAAENGKSFKQSHATERAGECAALPSADAEGVGMPIASGPRQVAMQDARRD